MQQVRPSRILGFDGLRAICVIAVYLSHKCELRFYAAQMGVWVFLALSGFLIIGELHRQRLAIEDGRYGTVVGLRIFAIKRALRIFPAYYGLLACLFVLRRFYAWVGPDLGFRYHFVYLSNVFFAYVWPSGSPFGVLWTLSVEQQFYIMAPLALLFTPARRHVALCIGFAACAAIGHLAMANAGLGANAIYLTSPWNFAIMALGGCAGVMREQARSFNLFRGPLPLMACVAAMGAYAATWLIYQTDNPEQAFPLFGVTAALVGLVMWVSLNQESRVVRLLEWRPLRSLGVISYGFYLVHNFVPNPLGKALPLYFGVSVAPWITLTLGAGIGFVISVCLAQLSWRYYERPILSLKSALIRAATVVPPRAMSVTAMAEEA